MGFTAAEQAAMARALVLAATPGVPLAPGYAGWAASCSRTTAATVAEGHHRGAGTPHAEADALARAGSGCPRHHRRGDPRALQPHRPHRTVRGRR